MTGTLNQAFTFVPLQVLFIILFGIHPFVPPEQISSGRSCVMIVIENSTQGKLLLPEWALQQMPGAADLLKRVSWAGLGAAADLQAMSTPQHSPHFIHVSTLS